jgi:hypothetical protein
VVRVKPGDSNRRYNISSKQQLGVYHLLEVAMKQLRFFRLGRMVLGVALGSMIFSGCATYVTPGPGAKLADLSQSDWDIEKLMSRKPAAQFPARIAMIRVQAAGYKSYGNAGYGTGRYSVVTTRDIEEERHFERVKNLPLVAGVASINRLLLPADLETDRPLRQAAASLQADMLLLYTLDTSFRIDETNLGPFSVVTLGFLPNKEAIVTATASAVLYDVRSGFVYGLAESTARERQRANVWTTQNAIDNSRLEAERKSFDQLLDEFVKMWKGVTEQHAIRMTVP